MKNEDTYTVHRWMIKELNLKWNELFLYAIIYEFYKKGSPFRASIRHLQEWFNCSKPTAIHTKKSLVKKGLIIETESQACNEFKVVFANLTTIKSNLL